MDYEVGDTYTVYSAAAWHMGGIPVPMKVFYVGVTPTTLDHVFISVDPQTGMTPLVLGIQIFDSAEKAMQWSLAQCEAVALASGKIAREYLPDNQKRFIEQPWEYGHGSNG